jgi:adenylate cyclase
MLRKTEGNRFVPPLPRERHGGTTRDGTMREVTRQRLNLIYRIMLVGMAWGALYGWLISGKRLSGSLYGLLTGFIISAALSSFEIIGMRSSFGLALRQRPFAQVLAAKTVIYLGVIMLGQSISTIGSGAAPSYLTLLYQTLSALAIALAFNFVLQVNTMLGQGELMKFLRGRYSRPHEEERIFLFLDLVGSTAIAETIGGVRFLEFLNQAYDDIADSILEHRGRIHKYVGDEVIVTWTAEAGLPDAACVACAVATEERLAAGAELYRARFGVVPQFRCGLHLGRVVSGELGSVKREIAYLGDTMNTTARLIDACREERRSIVASDALLQRVVLPPTIVAEPLGALTLRGKQEMLLVHALGRAPRT